MFGTFPFMFGFDIIDEAGEQYVLVVKIVNYFVSLELQGQYPY